MVFCCMNLSHYEKYCKNVGLCNFHKAIEIRSLVKINLQYRHFLIYNVNVGTSKNTSKKQKPLKSRLLSSTKGGGMIGWNSILR